MYHPQNEPNQIWNFYPQQVKENIIQLVYCRIEDQVVDIYYWNHWKVETFEYFGTRFGMINLDWGRVLELKQPRLKTTNRIPGFNKQQYKLRDIDSIHEVNWFGLGSNRFESKRRELFHLTHSLKRLGKS